jgi:hypothetical protein
VSAGASDGFEGSDRDYVDGELLERNWGEARHGRTQCRLTGALAAFEAALGIETLVEIRIRINPHRYRVADLAVWRSSSDLAERSDVAHGSEDYFDAGVEWVWLIDTEERIALVYSRQNPLGESVTVLRTESPVVEIALESLLA